MIDAQSLGFITFHRDPLPSEISSLGNMQRLSASILEKLRKGLSISVTTKRPPSAPIPEAEHVRINPILLG